MAYFQILHGELEASLQAAEERLDVTNYELDRQKILNEKLENDLLHMDKHKMNGKLDGIATPSETSSLDGLAGIELGKKTTVSSSNLVLPFVYIPVLLRRIHLQGRHRYLSHPLRTRQYYLLSRVNETGSDNVMPNLKR